MSRLKRASNDTCISACAPRPGKKSIEPKNSDDFKPQSVLPTRSQKPESSHVRKPEITQRHHQPQNETVLQPDKDSLADRTTIHSKNKGELTSRHHPLANPYNVPPLKPNAWKKSGSPSKNKPGWEGKAGKYVLPSIPEKGTRQSVLNKKVNSTPRVVFTSRLTESTAEPALTNQQQSGHKQPLFVPGPSCIMPEGQTRSISNIRSQGSLLSHPLLTPGLLQKTPAENWSPSHRNKKMKKLKLLINETNESLRARNRSVSIESLNTSPEQRIAHMCGTLESGRPTDGSSNERTSEESRKPNEGAKPKVSFKIGPGKSSRKSLISPPLLEPQPYSNAGTRNQLQSRVINSIVVKAEAMKKNFSTAQKRNEDRLINNNVSSFAVPGDENYKRIVTFTEHLKHDYVVPSTARASNHVKLNKEIMNTVKTPQAHGDQEQEEMRRKEKLRTIPTLSSGDLVRKLKAISGPDHRPTSFSKYLQLKPELYHDTYESSRSPTAQASKSPPPFPHETLGDFSPDSSDKEGLGSFEGTGPTSNSSKPKLPSGETLGKSVADTYDIPKVKAKKSVPGAKAFRIIRKLIKAPTVEVVPTADLNAEDMEKIINEIPDFPDAEGIEDKKGEKEEEKVKACPEEQNSSSLTVSHIDYSEMKECFHIQKEENVSLFAALSANYNGGPVRLAVHSVILADPISIFPETFCFGQQKLYKAITSL